MSDGRWGASGCCRRVGARVWVRGAEWVVGVVGGGSGGWVREYVLLRMREVCGYMSRL